MIKSLKLAATLALSACCLATFAQTTPPAGSSAPMQGGAMTSGTTMKQGKMHKDKMKKDKMKDDMGKTKMSDDKMKTKM